MPDINIQWNLSWEATPFAPEMWPHKSGGLSSVLGLVNTFLLRFTSTSGLGGGGGVNRMASQKIINDTITYFHSLTDVVYGYIKDN